MSSSILYFTAFLIVTSSFVKIGSSQSSNNALDYDFLRSEGFENIVRRIVKKTETADVNCKLDYGVGAYYSYIGECDNCSNYCADPGADKKQQCLRKCAMFMVNREIKQENEGLKKEIKHLTSRLEAQDIKVNAVLGVCLLLLLVPFATLYCYHKCYVLPRSKQYSPSHIHPAGDVILSTRPFTAVEQDNRIDDGYVTTPASRESIPR